MKNKHGFTLLEMAIALIVIALLVSGVFVAQDLIQNAKLKAFASQITHYKKAYHDFEDIYNAKAGDFSAAQAIWGSDVQNGNGDNVISFCDGFAGAYCDYYESFYAWEHIEKAELLQLGGLTGDVVSSTCFVPTQSDNVPATNMLTNFVYLVDNNKLYVSEFGQTLTICHASLEDYHNGEIDEEITNALDSIMDDGNTATGNIIRHSRILPKRTAWLEINLE